MENVFNRVAISFRFENVRFECGASILNQQDENFIFK